MFIHDEYKPEIIANVLKRQRMMIDKINANITVDPRLFLLLDDCIYDQSWVKDKNVRSLFMNGMVTSRLCLLLQCNMPWVFRLT